MSAQCEITAKQASGAEMGFFERYLTLWVALCIVAGILLGKVAPGVAESLDAMAITVNGAPVVSIPIALCLFFMMYPIMVKIDFNDVIRAGKTPKPVLMTLGIKLVGRLPGIQRPALLGGRHPDSPALFALLPLFRPRRHPTPPDSLDDLQA